MLLDAAESQLVLVDYQERLMPAIHDGPAVVANARRLAEIARMLGELFLRDAAEMYDKLEHAILPLYRQRDRWIDVMKAAISVNGSHFTTERMLRDYMMKAYDD